MDELVTWINNIGFSIISRGKRQTKSLAMCFFCPRERSLSRDRTSQQCTHAQTAPKRVSRPCYDVQTAQPVNRLRRLSHLVPLRHIS